MVVVVGGWVVIAAAITAIKSTSDNTTLSSSSKSQKRKKSKHIRPSGKSGVIIISNRISVNTSASRRQRCSQTTQLHYAAAQQRWSRQRNSCHVTRPGDSYAIRNLTIRASVAISTRIPLCVSESADPTIYRQAVSKTKFIEVFFFSPGPGPDHGNGMGIWV